MLEGAACSLLLPLLFSLVDRAEAFGERVLVDVVLVVEVRVWITCNTFIEDLSLRALGVNEHVVNPAELFKILQFSLQFLLIGPIGGLTCLLINP